MTDTYIQYRGRLRTQTMRVPAVAAGVAVAYLVILQLGGPLWVILLGALHLVPLLLFVLGLRDALAEHGEHDIEILVGAGIVLAELGVGLIAAARAFGATALWSGTLVLGILPVLFMVCLLVDRDRRDAVVQLLAALMVSAALIAAVRSLLTLGEPAFYAALVCALVAFMVGLGWLIRPLL